MKLVMTFPHSSVQIASGNEVSVLDEMLPRVRPLPLPLITTLMLLDDTRFQETAI